MEQKSRQELLKYALLCQNTSPTDKWKGVEWAIVDRVLVIKGSNETRDWFRNFNIKTKSRGHSGFKNAALYLMDHIDVDSIDVIIGHSQGGAIAQLLAYAYSKEAITFGSPMVSTMPLVVNDTTRVVNCNDIVPRLPNFGGYQHSGNLIYLDYAGNIKSSIDWKDRWKGRLRAWSKLQFFDSFYDHDISRYIKALSKNL